MFCFSSFSGGCESSQYVFGSEQTGAYVSFQAEGKLLAKVAGQGKVAPLITKGGLKSNGHNLSIGLKNGPVGSAIQIAK